jgi:ubiquinone/menaquinone biosynthesis C-methylase UbiE
VFVKRIESIAPASLLPLLYASEQTSGWNQGMRAITHALLAGVTLPDGALVEVGCGGGQLLAEIQEHYPTRLVIGIDLHPAALAHAQQHLHDQGAPGQGSLVQAALPVLPLGEGEVALLMALDVFDQQGVEMDAALAESYRVLRSGGALVMRVSAHPSLYGAHDLAFHTGQRYTRRQLFDALLRAGFVVQRLTYVNSLLALPVAALRLAHRWGLLAWHEELYQQRILHAIAKRLLRQEALWLYHNNLPWGLSLCAVARKP